MTRYKDARAGGELDACWLKKEQGPELWSLGRTALFGIYN